MAAADINTTSIPDNAPPSALVVGMSFVHEFYTFLNREPSRLHLFYNKHSTMSHGFQGEEVETCHGQQAIKSKIAGLDFDDCKVMVSNVDGQGSFGNGIILQVLGELSNKGGPAQKFVQTFFLAEQQGGYYVHNDLFRFLKEDLDDDEEEDEMIISQENHADPAPVVISSLDIRDQALISEEKPAAVEASVPAADLTAATEETVTRTQVQESQAPAASLAQVTAGETKKTGEKKSAERKPEKKTTDKKAEKRAADKKDIKADDSVQDKLEAATPSDLATTTPNETAVAAVAAENASEVRAASPALAPAAPQPPKQKTWANLAANNSTQWAPQVAAVKAGAVTAPVTSPAVPTSAPKAAAASQASQTPRPRPNGREEYHSIYIKNVTERMSLTQLREAFSKFGSITHLEYTQKKNCAFLDFSTAEAMNAALKQNTVPVGSEIVLAEERRRNSNNANGGPRAFNNHQGGSVPSQGQNGPRGGGARVNNARGGGPSDRKPVQGNRTERATSAVAAK